MARVARALTDAVFANADVQAHLRDLNPPKLWTVDGVRRNPSSRVEFEHTTVIGGIAESLSAAKNKSWGRLLGVFPLKPDDPVYWCRVLFIYKSTSPYNRRFEQRRELKRLLGRRHRSLATHAARATKRDFLTRYLTEDGIQAIRRRLGMTPGWFWRVAKGKEFIDLPKARVQLSLFET